MSPSPSPFSEHVDSWESPSSHGPYATPTPADCLGSYAQSSALARFDRDELRSSERDTLATAVAASMTGALGQCRAIVDSAAASAVDDFLAAHPDARSALHTA